MIALFSKANGRLILDALPKEFKYNQDYSICKLLPALNQVRTGNARLKVTPTLMVQTDSLMCHDGAKITEKMSPKGSGRAPHPISSSDISCCDFWAFGTINGMIKNRHLQGPEEILRAIQEPWSHFTFQDFENVFNSRMERLTWMIATSGEHCH
jgi:hypothetical protein